MPLYLSVSPCICASTRAALRRHRRVSRHRRGPRAKMVMWRRPSTSRITTCSLSAWFSAGCAADESHEVRRLSAARAQARVGNLAGLPPAVLGWLHRRDIRKAERCGQSACCRVFSRCAGRREKGQIAGFTGAALPLVSDLGGHAALAPILPCIEGWKRTSDEA